MRNSTSLSSNPRLRLLQNPLDRLTTANRFMNRNTPRLTFPDHLPPEAALALFDCLADLVEVVWQHYEPVLLDQILNELNTTPDVDAELDFDGDIPF